ncbi:MAG: hypothetical protein NTW25_13365 [Candidatus Kapabacteria bacterium]|nr:hypothetical protein [Candidatus Kapabacteria bacterium]
MKSLIILLLFEIIIINTSNAQYSISPRLGAEIDKSEKEYFGLFPNIKNFTSAKANVLADNKVEINITRTVKGIVTDTTFIVSTKLANNLASYIEGFEQCRNKERQVNWNALEGLATNVPALESDINEGIELDIVTNTNEKIHGKLLFASDSTAVIVQNATKYNWSNFSQNVKLVKVQNMNYIKIERTGSFWQGVGFGALIGGGGWTAGSIAGGALKGSYGGLIVMVGAIFFTAAGTVIGGVVGAILDIDTDHSVDGQINEFKDFLPYLKNNSTFSNYPPPELVKFANQ